MPNLRSAPNFTKTFSPSTRISTVSKLINGSSSDDSLTPNVEANLQNSEFASKKWVWLPDDILAFIKGFVINENADGTFVVRCEDDSDRIVLSEDVDRVNPPKFDKAQDMAELTYLNEASVVHNLSMRYKSDSIYTYSGLFLVAVNPYKALPIYGADTIMAYKNTQREDGAPHIYAISDLAFRNMLEEHENQSILVTGESGAGKTENTKKVIQYLAAITNSHTPAARNIIKSPLLGPQQSFTLEQQILQANPILETFGNAQTVRNNNSSRFGKFIRIEFGRSGQIAGASIDWYLLEKSRVIYQNPKERNYHIFYQLIQGLPKDLKTALILDSDFNAYSYLRGSNKQVEGVDDKAEFKSLINSFKIMGFSAQEQTEIFRVMSAILNIGNIELGSERSDQARILNVAQAERVCHLLGINSEQFVKGLLRPRVKAGREWVLQSRSAEQVKNSLNALAKTLYERTFGSIVDRINQMLERSTDNTSFIGVLDIAGFEIFEHNSFEQLCINYTNERLQQFFNHHMFVLEQEEYSRENIEWKYIDFGHDLQPTIDLIEKPNPIGIFSCLDEDCVMPKATDQSFTEKLHHLWNSKSSKYRPSRLSQGFVLTHYAAEVEYSTEGWLEKNKDPLNDNITQLLVQSTEPNIRHLFAHEATNQGPGGKMTKKGLFRTVAQRHKEQLNHLMNQLNSTHPHFVRCIIPNHKKSPHIFDNVLVLDQLRCNGVLEGIRIARTGYPNRLFFSEFRLRYEVLVSGMPKGYIEGQKACHLILKKLSLDENLYKVGLTKVFFKSGVLAELEERREAMVRELITQFQSISRGYLQRQKVRKTLFKAQATSIIKRNFELYLGMKSNPWWKLYVKMRPLLIVSRESGRSKAQDMTIKKLEQNVKEIESERDAIKGNHKKIESELEKMAETLESERQLAQDKDEFLKRSQERENDLEEQLTGALEDMDRLEIQCEELLIAKRKVDIQSEAWRSELENGANIIEHLEKEKTKLKNRLYLLEEEIAQSASDQANKLEEYNQVREDFNQLKQTLNDRNELIKELEDQITISKREAQQKLDQANSTLDTVNSRLSKLTSENNEQREELEELYKTSSDYEDMVRRKEEELDRVKNINREHQVVISETRKFLKDAEKNHDSVSLKLNISERELSNLKAKCLLLEKEEKETRRLLQAKVSDNVKNDEGRKLLNGKINELHAQINRQEKEASTERQSHATKISAQQARIDLLKAEKEKLSITVKQLRGVEEEKITLNAQLETSRQHAAQNSSNRLEISSLTRKLHECEDARNRGLKFIDELKNRISDAGAFSNKLRKDLDLVSLEKSQLFNQITQLKKFIEEDLANKESLILEKKRITQDLENTRHELSNVTFEYKKLSRELEKKGDHLKRMRTSFTDDAASQRAKLNKEKADLEINGKTLQRELENLKVECATLRKQKEKMSQSIDDLTYDISVEKKTISSSERQRLSLQDQLDKLHASYDKERRERSEAEVAKRKMTSQLESMRRELADKSAQLVASQKVGKLSHLRNQSWDGGVNKLDPNILAKQLEDTERLLKKSEESRILLENQLNTSSSNWGNDRPRSIPNVASHSSLLKELMPGSVPSGPNYDEKSLRATNGIKSAIDSIYHSYEGRTSAKAYHRSRNTMDFDKENDEPLSVIDSVKSLNVQNKSIEEIEGLLTNYESSKRDLMSVFQETSKKLLETKDALAVAELENLRLEKELQNGQSEPQLTESDSETLNANISDLELRLDAEISMNQDLAGSLRLYKSRAEDYYSKLESAETVVLKASRAETFAKAQWKESEASLASALKEAKEQENKAIHLQSKIQLLEDKLEDSTIDLTHSQETQRRLAREIQDLKERRKHDSSDMESSLNTMRDRYKDEIKSISEELEKEKRKMGSLQTENRHLQHDLDMLKVRNNFDTLDPSWSSFKTQLEDKIQELTKANEQAVLSQQDSQRRVGSLLSQVRTLRTTMEEITANRDQLQEEKRNLERRLNDVSEQLEELVQAPGVQSSPGSEDELHQLKSSVRQKTQDANSALERLRAIEDSKLDLQKQLQNERYRLNELMAERTSTDKENKDLHLKVVDLEAQLLGVKNYDSKFLVQKVGQLEKQLEDQTQRYAEESRSLRSNDRFVKDLQTQILQKEKISTRLQDEIVRNESKIRNLQETVESLQGLETTQRLATRRAEREARDLKETSLRLEKELEDWKTRFHSISSKRNSRAFG